MVLAPLLLLALLSAAPPRDAAPSFEAAANAFVAAFRAGDVEAMLESWSDEPVTRDAIRARLSRLAMVRTTRTVVPSLDPQRHLLRLDLCGPSGLLTEQYDVAFDFEAGAWRTVSFTASATPAPIPRAREIMHRSPDLLEAGRHDEALAAFTEAARLAEEAGDVPTRSAALRGLGNMAHLRGDVATATRHFQASADVARAGNDPVGLALALDRLAMLDLNAGQYARAEERLREALQIFRDRNERYLATYMLNALANVLGARGDTTVAKALYEEVFAISEELHDIRGGNAALINLGANARDRGQYRESEAFLTRALDRSRAEGDASNVAYAYCDLGITLAAQGKLAEAVRAFLEGLAMNEQIGLPEAIIPALADVGDMYRRLGNPEQARAHLERSRALAEKTGFRPGIAVALHHLARLRLDAGDARGARELATNAFAIDEEIGNRADAARALHTLGMADLLAGDRTAARAAFTKSLAQAEELGARETMTATLVMLAEVEDDAARALALADRAQTLAADLGLPEHLWQTHLTRGRALRRSGRMAEARTEVERAVTIVEELRRGMPGEEMSQQQAFERTVGPYHELTSLLVEQGDVAGAFEAAERGKARVLLNVLHNGRPDYNAALSDEERVREASLGAAVAEVSRAYRDALVGGKPTAAASEQLRRARLAYDAFLTRIYAAHPHLRVERGDVTPLRAADLAPLLAGGSADVVLAFVVTDTRTYLFSARRRAGAVDLRVRTIAITRDALAAKVRRFRELVATHDLTYGASARALYDLLLGPVATRLRDAATICLVPDGPLWELPFQALEPADGLFLIDEHALFSVPSLTELREMSSRARRTSDAGRLLAIGNPLLPGKAAQNVFRDSALAPLPNTETEIRAVAALYGRNRTRIHVQREAREEVVKAEAGQFDVLHFATHAILDDQNALYSRLVLSPPATAAEDGLLEAREIMRLDLQARLAVLSACETARGRISSGEGVIGMSWALFVAGVPATVVSQWKVDSASTAGLMIEFHRHLRSGRGKAEALRQAALRTRTNPAYRHPFYWAAFVVVGDAR